MSQQRTQLSCWYSFLLGRTLYVSLSPLSVHKHLIMFIETVSEPRPLSYVVKACP